MNAKVFVLLYVFLMLVLVQVGDVPVVFAEASEEGVEAVAPIAGETKALPNLDHLQLKKHSPVKAAGIMTVLFLVVFGIGAYFVKRFYGHAPSSKADPLMLPLAKAHLGGQVYGSLLRVRDQEFLVVVGNKNAPGISVTPIGESNGESNKEQLHLSPQMITAAVRKKDVDHAA